MLAWLRQRKQRAHLAEVARILEAENDRIREENRRLMTLVRALRDVNEHLDKRLLAEERQ